MKVFEKGQRVVLTNEAEDYAGVVLDFYCDYGEHRVDVQTEGGRRLSPNAEWDVEPVKGDEVEDLTLLAEMLNKARLQAKPGGEHVARANLTRETEAVLYRTLMLLTDELLDVNTVFNAILAGTDVREALALAEDGED